MQDKKQNIWVIASVVRRISKLQCAVSAPLTSSYGIAKIMIIMFPLLFIHIMKLHHMTGKNTDTMLISEASAEFMVLGKKL